MKHEEATAQPAPLGQVERGVGPAVPKRADFDTPHEATAIEAAFPATVAHLMPAYSDIPEDFKRQGNPWVQWQQQWFYAGLKQLPTAKPGIDLNAAMRHLKTIQGSFEPKHEHKEAAVAFLADRWLERA